MRAGPGTPGPQVAAEPLRPDPAVYGTVQGLRAEVIGAEIGHVGAEEAMRVTIQVLVPGRLLRLPKVIAPNTKGFLWPVADVALHVERTRLALPSPPAPDLSDVEGMPPSPLAILGLADLPDLPAEVADEAAEG